MTISINDNFPPHDLRVLIVGDIHNIISDEYLSNKKIV